MRQLTLDFFKKIPSREFRITFSTALTITRIMLTPFIVYAMLTGRWGLAFLFFIIASLTDLFDGMLARWLNERTFLGTCLDPIADKFLLVSCFATLACTHTLPFSIPQPFLLLVLWRETFLIGGALVIYFSRGSIRVEPSRLGKITTFVQILFITWLFACYFFKWVPVKTYYGALFLMTSLIVASFIQYGKMGMEQWYKK
jgi:cardiolipin synthase (CMP-forming)